MADQLKLTFFGTAAGFPTVARQHTTAIGLWRGRELYLFDAGDGVAGQFAQMRIAPEAVRAIFLTHLHADHVGGLAVLIQWMQLNRRRASLPIYLPERSLAGLRDYLHLVYLYPISEFQLEFRPVSAGLVHREEGLEVTAVHSHHLEPGEPGRANAGQRVDSQAFSYLIRAAGKTVYLSGDLAGPEEAAKHADAVDIAVVELAHFTAEEVGAAFSASALPRLVLAHINDDLERFEQEIPARLRSAGFQGNIIVAKDGDEIAL